MRRRRIGKRSTAASPPRRSEPACPASATNAWVAWSGPVAMLLGVAILNFWQPVHHIAYQSLVVMGCAAFGIFLPDLLWQKVQRRTLVAPAAAGDWPRSLTKCAGLLGVVGLIALLYWLLPEYRAAGFYANYWEALRVVLPMWGLLALPYIFWVDRRMQEPYDALWHLGRLVTLRWHRVPGRIIGQYLLGWLVKGFFLPLMFTYLCNELNRLLHYDLGSLHRLQGIYDWASFTLYFIDVALVAMTYFMSLRLTDTHIRSTESTMLGWVTALVCYQPFWSFVNSQYIDYDSGVYWTVLLKDLPWLAVVWGCAIISLVTIYVWATVSFGGRFSNLTHRGIITNGPYRYSKHPAYLAKNLSWWLISTPFLSSDDPATRVRHCLMLGLLNLIYYVRAKTEERHLGLDPVYVEYSAWIDRNGLLRFLNPLPVIGALARWRPAYVPLTGTLLLTVLVSACEGGKSTGDSGQISSASSSSSSGGGTPFWIPYSVTSAGTGHEGLFVLPSNSLTSAPTFVTTNAVTVLGSANQVTVDGAGVITKFAPATTLYAALGADGSAHMYGLNLSDASVTPTPTQIGSLSASALANICDFGQGQTNLTDPTTIFVVLHMAGANGCNTGGVYEVVHYKDAPSTAPQQVNITTTRFTALYQGSGALGGLVSLDASSGNLYFYASETFAPSATLATGVSAYVDLYDGSRANQNRLGNDFAFLNVKSGSTQALYRVAASGGSSKVYIAAGSLGYAVGDSSSVYVTDTAGDVTRTETIWQVPLNGVGAPLKLYGAPIGPGSGYTLVGSNGSLLVFDSFNTDMSTASITSTLLSVPTGQASTGATSIGAPFAGSSSAFMAAPTLDDPPADVLFVTVTEFGSGGPTTVNYSSEALTPGGTVLQALLPNSMFEGRTSALSSAVFQIKGIADTSGGGGGGGVYSVKIADLTATAFTTGSGAYGVPAGYSGQYFGLSNSIGAASLSSLDPAGGATQAAAFDISHFLMVPVSLPNANVALDSAAATASAGRLLVHVTPDATHTTQQALTAAAGGTITAIGADGTSYVLAIPPGALPADTTVSLTPLSGVFGLPLRGGLGAGVQFAPEGLLLNTPAALTITPVTALPTARLVGFGYTALGDQFHLEPTGGDGSAIVMAVRHFSGDGIVVMGPGTEVGQLPEPDPPTPTADAYAQEAMGILQEFRSGQIDKATYDASIAQLVTPYYEDIIKPMLEAGLGSDAAFTTGAQAGLSFLRQLEITGIAPDQVALIGPEIIGLIKQGFSSVLDRASVSCNRDRDYGQVERIVVAQRQGQLLGWLPEGSIDFSKFAGCIIFAVEPAPAAATINVNGTQQYSVQLLNALNQSITNADAVKFNWTSGSPSIASVAGQGNQQASATGLQEGSTGITPAIAEAAYTATGLGIGTTQFGTAALTVTRAADCAAYVSAKSWTANVVTTFSQHATGSPPSSTEIIDVTVSHHQSYTFNLSGNLLPVWQGGVMGGQVNVMDTAIFMIPGQPPSTTTATGTGIGGGAALSVATLTIDPVACTYRFNAEMNADVTFTHDPASPPPFTTPDFGDGVRVAGYALAPLTAGAVPTITGRAALPVYALTAPVLGTDPGLNAFVSGMGDAPLLSEIIQGDRLGSTANVSWTLTAVH